MRSYISFLASVCALALPIGLNFVTAQDAQRGVDVEVQPGKVNVDVAPATRKEKETLKPWRASKFIGLAVRNAANEDLGKIEDLVIDFEQGQIRYAALSFGGFLGIGDKLFAVPWQALRIQHDENDTYVRLNVDQERLKTAPGFEKDNWPDFGNPRLSQEIDDYYRPQRGASLPRNR